MRGIEHGFLGVLFDGLAGLNIGILVIILGVIVTVLSSFDGSIGGATTK